VAMKILIVDDELVSRLKMKKIMESFGRCTEADCGRRALDLIHGSMEKGSPFDLITMDISMSEMDGTEVLRKIRESEKTNSIPLESRVKVFMVTAHSDRDTIISCIKSGCNDYIMKPFSKKTVVKKLLENGLIFDDGNLEMEDTDLPPKKSKRSMLDYIIEQFKNGEINLPSLSKIYTKFNECIEKNAQMEEIAGLLKQDPAISSKLISISNSAFYRNAMENHTLDQAISRLGIKVTKQTVDMISQKSLYLASHEKYSAIMESLWEHSLSCAHACQLVSESLGRVPSKDLFTMGLLHDIGKLFLLQVVGDIEKKWHASDAPSYEELEEWLEEHHCRAGSSLLIKWGFPQEFVNIAQHHDNPGDKDVTFELLVVHAANEIIKSMGYVSPGSRGTEPKDSDIIQKLELTPQMIDNIKTQIKTRMEQLKDSLG
jgi:putative nucleotidyltransferase with HDIG domain